MKRQYRGSRREPSSVDPDFLESLSEDSSRNSSSNHQTQRKNQQFCRQVQRALNLALGNNLDNLFIEDVSPAPDCGRLLVRVLIPPGLSVAATLEKLAQESPRLRSEVAAAITRKRAPELYFAPANETEGGSHDE